MFSSLLLFQFLLFPVLLPLSSLSLSEKKSPLSKASFETFLFSQQNLYNFSLITLPLPLPVPLHLSLLLLSLSLLSSRPKNPLLTPSLSSPQSLLSSLDLLLPTFLPFPDPLLHGTNKEREIQREKEGEEGFWECMERGRDTSFRGCKENRRP